MMSGYYLSEKVEYYGEGRWLSINQRIDSFLRSIFGNFHWEGPRNYLGPGQEGQWVRFGNLDEIYIIPFGLLMTFAFIWLYTNTNFKDIIIYLSMIIGVVLWLGLNHLNPQMWFEGFGSGYIKDFKRNLKIGILLGLIFSIISIITIGSLKSGEIIGFVSVSEEQIVKLITQIITPLAAIILIPYVENLTLGCFFIPSLSKYMGIIPSVVIISFGTGILHLAIYYRDYANPIPYILMSILYGFIVYPIQLAYKSKIIGWTAHSEVNLFAYLLKIIKI